MKTLFRVSCALLIVFPIAAIGYLIHIPDFVAGYFSCTAYYMSGEFYEWIKVRKSL